MDTSGEAMPTDTLGRRTGPRQKHTIEEKRRIVEATHVRGASVATVARRHQVNANQVFYWRQQYRQGLLEVKISDGAPEMLPVKVTTPTVMPAAERRKERAAMTGGSRASSPGSVEA